MREALQKVFPTTKATSVIRSELPGFYQVVVDGQVFFVSNDGKYLIHGSVFDIEAKQDIGEKQLAALRKGALAKIPHDKELVFAPPNPKYTVTVFTDVDCPYCRQFHKQIAEYNKLGIAVNYVLFPLPMHVGADKKAETVWCAGDRNTAVHRCDERQGSAAKLACANPIAELIGSRQDDGRRRHAGDLRRRWRTSWRLRAAGPAGAAPGSAGQNRDKAKRPKGWQPAQANRGQVTCGFSIA